MIPDIEENFNRPFFSKSIQEFWRRWHISLSSWFRDYVYIPLGGNRKNVYLNLAIVFLLTGIWHGASWHYVIWGIWNGMFILSERLLKNKNPKNKRAESINNYDIGCILKKVYTLAVVNLGWVIFRAPGTKDAVKYLCTMFGILRPEKPGFTLFWYLDRWTVTIMIMGILFASSIPSRAVTYVKPLVSDRLYVVGKYILLMIVFYFTIMRIVSGTYNPFIYFQF